MKAARLADEVDLDAFGFGEHHTASMPLSSPTSLVVAAAAQTQRIGLSTTVTVLSTDEPLRVFLQLATAAAVAPGRIEAVAGRGSSAITFPIFDLDESDYDMLCAFKPERLLAANRSECVSFAGPHRRQPLTDALIVPRPQRPLKIWLGSGGSPESVPRAVQLGLPLYPGILGGTVDRWAQYGSAYRNAWAQAGHRRTPPTSRSRCTGSSATTAPRSRSTSSTSCGCSRPEPPRSAGRDAAGRHGA